MLSNGRLLLEPDEEVGLPSNASALVAIMDWWSRKVLAWRLSNTMDVQFCVDALDEALSRHGRPEIFNTDQGLHRKAVALAEVRVRLSACLLGRARGSARDR